jgi:hypothetical protein
MPAKTHISMSYSLTGKQTLTSKTGETLRTVVTYHVNNYNGTMACGMTQEAMRAQTFNVHQTALYVSQKGDAETNCPGCKAAQAKRPKCECDDSRGYVEPNRDCPRHGDGN